MKKIAVVSICLLFISIFFILSCTIPDDLPDDDPLTGITTDSAKVIGSFSDLPTATLSNKGQLYYIIDVAKFYYSDGTAWVNIDLTGPAGTNGTNGTNGGTGGSATFYTTNTTIGISQSPLSIIGSFIVAPGVTLTIDKGVNVVFYPNSGLYVEGNLVVNGINSSKVLFEQYFSAYSPIGGIFFGKQSSSSISYAQFNFVQLSYGANSDKSHTISYTKFLSDEVRPYYPISSYYNGTHLSISDSTFLNNSNPTYAIGATSDIEVNRSIINGFSTGIMVSGITNKFDITNTSFKNCKSSAITIASSLVPINLSGNNYDTNPTYFLTNYTSQPVNMTNSYFGGLTGSAVTSKISSTGIVDTSGIKMTPYVINGCGW